MAVYPPVRTSVAIRHRMSNSDLWGYVDPRYGVPEQNCPMVWDFPTAGVPLLRPFSSAITADEAAVNFAGWSNDYVQPGISTTIQLIQHAVVEVELLTPVAAHLWTRVRPHAISGAVSNRIFTTVADASPTDADWIGRVWKECGCEPDMVPCPPAAAAPETIAGGSTAVPTRQTVRMVWVEFNVLWKSKTAIQA